MKPRSFYYSCTPEADRETQFESFRSMGAHESEIFIDVCGHRKSSRSSLAMLKRIGLREGDRLTIPTLYCLSDLKKGLADELNWLRQHGIQLRIADIPMTMRCSDETEQRLASEMLYQVIDATVLKDREEKRQKQSEGTGKGRAYWPQADGARRGVRNAKAAVAARRGFASRGWKTTRRVASDV